MFNVKKKIMMDYQNIIILVLLLAIFFSFGRLLSEQKALAASSQPNSVASLETTQASIQDKQGAFFQSAIKHVFPAVDSKDDQGSMGTIKEIYKSVISNIFFIDLNNPYSFVKSQFPGINTYNERLALQPKEDEIPEPTTPTTNPNISFEDIGGIEEDPSNVSQEPTIDNDDRSELEEGIYVPGREEVVVVDSLKPNGEISLENMTNVPAKIEFEKDKPHILIYHTHGTESYMPATEGNFHSLRKEYTVMAMGDIIKKELEEQGFNVIHDTTYHDHPSYNGSYARSLATVQKILKENPSIKVVLDLHRDGYDNIDESPNRDNIIKNNQAVFNNQTMSKFQFVIGPESPNRSKVENFAGFIKEVSDHTYPGLSKPILVKPYGKFNQFVVDHSILLELGSNANTIEEAKATAQIFADIFAKSLKILVE